MGNDSFHEIQLNGKQLVFLFMAGTVMAVVIFLCGVMVGRGVGTARAAELAAASVNTDPTAPQTIRSTPVPESGPSPSAQEDLSYPDRLQDSAAVPEVLREPIPPSPSTPTPETAAPDEPDLPEPPGNGFVVQVAAVRARAEAETIARRLAQKGYPSFVTTPPAGGPRVYRVRVGKYDDRREAQAVASRLEKQEQFKPWITR